MITLEVVALTPFAHEWLARGRRTGRHFRDRQGRSVQIGEWQPADWDGLLAMYGSFDLAQRTEGLPPLSEQRQAVWMEKLLGRGPNVIARAGGRVVGHAVLAAHDGAGSYELVLFVHQDYQAAGIGSALTDAILRLARRRGAKRVRLAAQPQNERALALHRRLGLERTRNDHLTSALIRLRGIAGALRFAWIPAFCAAIIAIASEHPRGRALAVALGLATVCLGLVVHASEIILGRPAPRARPGERSPSTGEWMAMLR